MAIDNNSSSNSSSNIFVSTPSGEQSQSTKELKKKNEHDQPVLSRRQAKFSNSLASAFFLNANTQQLILQKNLQTKDKKEPIPGERDPDDDVRPENIVDDILAEHDLNKDGYLQFGGRIEDNFTPEEFAYIAALTSDSNSTDISREDLQIAIDRGLITFETGVLQPTQVGKILAEHDKGRDGYLQYGGRIADNNFTAEEFAYIASLSSDVNATDISWNDLAIALEKGLVSFETGVLKPTQALELTALYLAHRNDFSEQGNAIVSDLIRNPNAPPELIEMILTDLESLHAEAKMYIAAGGDEAGYVANQPEHADAFTRTVTARGDALLDRLAWEAAAGGDSTTRQDYVDRLRPIFEDAVDTAQALGSTHDTHESSLTHHGRRLDAHEYNFDMSKLPYASFDGEILFIERQISDSVEMLEKLGVDPDQIESDIQSVLNNFRAGKTLVEQLQALDSPVDYSTLLSDENIQGYNNALYYGAMDPASAAAQINTFSDSLIANMLKFMPPEYSAGILQAFNPTKQQSVFAAVAQESLPLAADILAQVPDLERNAYFRTINSSLEPLLAIATNEGATAQVIDTVDMLNAIEPGMGDSWLAQFALELGPEAGAEMLDRIVEYEFGPQTTPADFSASTAGRALDIIAQEDDESEQGRRALKHGEHGSSPESLIASFFARNEESRGAFNDFLVEHPEIAGRTNELLSDPIAMTLATGSANAGAYAADRIYQQNYDRALAALNAQNLPNAEAMAAEEAARETALALRDGIGRTVAGENGAAVAASILLNMNQPGAAGAVLAQLHTIDPNLGATVAQYMLQHGNEPAFLNNGTIGGQGGGGTPPDNNGGGGGYPHPDELHFPPAPIFASIQGTEVIALMDTVFTLMGAQGQLGDFGWEAIASAAAAFGETIQNGLLAAAMAVGGEQWAANLLGAYPPALAGQAAARLLDLNDDALAGRILGRMDPNRAALIVQSEPMTSDPARAAGIALTMETDRLVAIFQNMPADAASKALIEMGRIGLNDDNRGAKKAAEVLVKMGFNPHRQAVYANVLGAGADSNPGDLLSFTDPAASQIIAELIQIEPGQTLPSDTGLMSLSQSDYEALPPALIPTPQGIAFGGASPGGQPVVYVHGDGKGDFESGYRRIMPALGAGTTQGNDFEDEQYVIVDDAGNPVPGLTVEYNAKSGKWLIERNQIGDVTPPELVPLTDAGIIMGQDGDSRAKLVSQYMADLKANYGADDGFNEHGAGRVPDVFIGIEGLYTAADNPIEPGEEEGGVEIEHLQPLVDQIDPSRNDQQALVENVLRHLHFLNLTDEADLSAEDRLKVLRAAYAYNLPMSDNTLRILGAQPAGLGQNTIVGGTPSVVTHTQNLVQPIIDEIINEYLPRLLNGNPSPDEVEGIILEMRDFIASTYGIDAIPIIFETTDGAFGAYSDNSNQIRLDPRILTEMADPRYAAQWIDTIVHEMTHAYQNQLQAKLLAGELSPGTAEHDLALLTSASSSVFHQQPSRFSGGTDYYYRSWHENHAHFAGNMVQQQLAQHIRNQMNFPIEVPTPGEYGQLSNERRDPPPT